jgi:uncharacterized membrane protein
MRKRKSSRPGIAAALHGPGQGGRSRTAAAASPELYRGQLPPWLSRALIRFPYFRRFPHPLLAHFPIVYMLATTFFSLLYLATGDQSFDGTAFYCLAAGVLFLPPTILTGLFTHWLNFPGKADKTVKIEKRLSYSLLAVSTTALVWRGLNPAVLHNLAGGNILYFLLVLAVTPLVTANSYFGGMLTFPLEAEDAAQPGARRAPGVKRSPKGGGPGEPGLGSRRA